MDKNTLWESALAELQLNLSAANFQTWFKGKTDIVALEDNLVEIACSSSYIKNWIESRYQGQIKSILEKVAGNNLNLMFVVKSLEKELHNKEASKRSAQKSFQPTPLFFDPDRKDFEDALSKARINPSFNFSSFVVGKSNELSWAVAKSIAGSRTRIYSSFFVYGGVGIGKTHLIQAIAQEVLRNDTSLKVLYCTCEDFTNELVTSIQTRTTTNFRTKYRSSDMLVIDDVQFLSGRESTQEEVFHTFNAIFTFR